MRWVGMYHAWERLEMHKEFWLEILKGRDNLSDLDVAGTIS